VDINTHITNSHKSSGNKEYANKSIICNVTQCKNHNNAQNYCALQCIRVGNADHNDSFTSSVSDNQITDCQSFVSME
jgi:uncharacterized membrane protein